MATNGVTESLPKRDVKNHLLFEIATEVANRGMLASAVLEESCNACWGRFR